MPKRGYTIIELLIVISIISILYGMSVYGYRDYKAKASFLTAVQDAKTLMTKALDLSLSPPVNDTGVNGYGVEFNKTQRKMTLFANTISAGSDKIYDAADIKIREEILPSGVNIVELSQNDPSVNTIFTDIGNKATAFFELPSSTPDHPYQKFTYFNTYSNYNGKIIFQRTTGVQKSVVLNPLTNLISIQ